MGGLMGCAGVALIKRLENPAGLWGVLEANAGRLIVGSSALATLHAA